MSAAPARSPEPAPAWRALVDGRLVEADVAADTALVAILRDHAGAMAVKPACEAGRCGACLVLLDGEPVNACLAMAWQADGRSIATAEGLALTPAGATIVAALAAEAAFQCGYCAPGFAVALNALLLRRPDAGEAEIRAALAGNLCRCTGYHSILRGALAAAAALSASQGKAVP
jgi:carbon-monoxide dehydrogenase small subunit